MPLSQGAMPAFQYATFDSVALCDLASSLRGGRVCTCDLSQTPRIGAHNWTVIVSFEDGIDWVFRSPSRRHFYSKDVDSMVMSSEVATMRYVREHTTIPVPQVFSYSSSASNAIGVPYILMSKAKGSALKDWTGLDRHLKEKILLQLGSIARQLSNLRFDRIGSLFEKGTGIEIGTCLDRGLLFEDRDQGEFDRGPFRTDADYYNALILGFQDQAKNGNLSPHCFIAPYPSEADYENDRVFADAQRLWNAFVIFGSKVDNSRNRTDHVLAGDLIRECIGEMIKTATPTADHGRPFVLCHPDLTVHNIFVDGNHNITGIIDWSFASTVPIPVLLGSIGMPQYRNAVEESLMQSFFRGFGGGKRKAGKQQVATKYDQRSIWLFLRLVNNFHFHGELNGFAEIWDRHGHISKDFASVFCQKRSSEEYSTICNELAADDPRPEKITENEAGYFGKTFRRDVVQLTVAMHLTMVSQWQANYSVLKGHNLRKNSGMFKADARLWKWILQCVELRSE